MSEITQNEHNRLAALEGMRQMTEWFGEVQPAQTTMLKHSVMLLTGSSRVILTLNTENRTFVYSYEDGENPPVKDFEIKVRQLVYTVLGKGWEVRCGTMPADDTRVSGKSGKAPKQKRVRRAKKARKLRSK